ncbi:MAG: type IV pilus assembly protein PilM [Parcubacteria group bacterium]|nr:type IV pilus assembly protein PilM [Parcubacteria group bacterium]
MSIFINKQDSFGLDISDLSLKVANIEKRGKQFEFTSFGCLAIPKGVIKDGQIQDEGRLVKAIHELLANVHGKQIKTKNVVCCLPEEKSFLDILQLPVLDPEETAQAVIFEAANHIPIPLEDVYFDFELIQPLIKNPKQQDILIAATPKKIVDGYFNALKKAGLRTQALEVEPLAIVRALVKLNVATKPLLIIDFGACRTSFIIFSGHNVTFSSTIPVSSNELTRVIAEKLNIKPKEAEDLKKSEGLEGDKKVFNAMTPVLTDLTQQIKNHLDYYKSHIPSSQGLNNLDNKVDRILLCGGGANLKGLANFLTSTFKIKVVLSNPLTNLKKTNLKTTPILDKEKSLCYATALGLALRGAQL